MRRDDSVFQEWLKGLEKRGLLEAALELVISRGLAADNIHAVAVLAELAAALPRPRPRSRDLGEEQNPVIRASYFTLERRLQVNGKEHRRRESPLYLGTISHQVAFRLQQGDELQLRADARQLRLLAPEFRLQPPNDELRTRSLAASQVLTKQGRLRMPYCNRIQALWQQAAARLSGERSWQEKLRDLRSLYPELRYFLRPVFGEYLDLIHCQSSAGRFREILTLSSWMGLLLFENERSAPRVLLTEVPLVNRQQETVSGWRADAAEVIRIDGQILDGAHRELLRRKVRFRYRSVDDFALDIRRNFGDEVKIQLVDYKFPAGDAGWLQVILASKLKRPLPEHLDQ